MIDGKLSVSSDGLISHDQPSSAAIATKWIATKRDKTHYGACGFSCSDLF